MHNHGPVLNLGNTAFRFPITASSSGGTMTLLTTNGDGSPDVNVFPHRHVVQYENFFCSRGAVQLWTQQWNATQNVRKLTAGDFGASPPNVTHTFQIVEPNTEMYGVVFDGGLE
jgi:quercetin dioxygenase-like cupin family protein